MGNGNVCAVLGNTKSICPLSLSEAEEKYPREGGVLPPLLLSFTFLATIVCVTVIITFSMCQLQPCVLFPLDPVYVCIYPGGNLPLFQKDCDDK